jgi:hypothetical protein
LKNTGGWQQTGGWQNTGGWQQTGGWKILVADKEPVVDDKLRSNWREMLVA